ncbi:DUF1993 domain-containing protein [Erythrobacter sp. HL-111]|uniref:DUF1993 family protein n=1 Tax=Erythrobacter sp. HL-111 TaxID=1798193 RepID=UPI0006DB3B6E|nr:DUF1993 domain-containing protein [Erythrobacter sp. HL-111]KPP83589.1 MAG: hypothetical protein HLUCCO15_14125 [Erythrobacteraceae bacterium HL-111]SDS29433.1 hypothetical protein SAMN04515621_1306 [Erythrobacter sp. HL-111]
MPLTLHAAFVPTAEQLLGGMRNVIDRAEAHVRAEGLDDADLIGAALAPDMWPLPWHVRACWVHSGYALGLMPTGEFTPDFTTRPESWDAMRAMVDEARAALSGVDEDDLERIADQPVAFVMGGQRLMEGTVSQFLLGFHQVNFQFHAATFYGILRMKGVKLGKMDYVGPMAMSLAGGAGA